MMNEQDYLALDVRSLQEEVLRLIEQKKQETIALELIHHEAVALKRDLQGQCAHLEQLIADKQKLLGELDTPIAEKRQEYATLTAQVAQIALERKDAADASRRELIELSHKVTELRLTIERLTDTKETLQTEIIALLGYKRELQEGETSLQVKSQDEKLTIEQLKRDIERYTLQRDDLLVEIARYRSDVLNLEKRSKELDAREHDLNVMASRLNPEYIKAFNNVRT